jgi:hypothetical protein
MQSLDLSGALSKAAFNLSTLTWSSVTSVALPTGVSAFLDINSSINETGNPVLYAVTSSSNYVYYTQETGGSAWAWSVRSSYLWDGHLDDGGIETSRPSPGYLSIHASRWFEDPAGIYSPVLFTTDNHGEVYLLDYNHSDAGVNGWNIGWRPFYTDVIQY